jgi:NAD(P)-dependent dehydrogenase (short-subunit alcohol dehydrogenase family)
MDLHLSGKTALITGGSKGIGLAVAERFAEEGCNVVLVSRTAADLEAARRRIEAKSKVKVEVRAADLSVVAEQQALVQAFPDVDILVNNAGAIRRGTLEEVDEALWQRYWDLKVFGYINLTRAYYTRMKARRSGVIINIIGVAGERLDAGYIAGSTGNASLIAFTKAMGGVSPDHGVRVVGLNPGSVMTEKSIISHKLQARDKFGDPERWPELLDSKPFGRAIKPEEISAMVALLASDLSGYTSGQVFTIDGGSSNRRNI